ncbi:hypothetical protein [Novosphingobium naphthalenivorans]|uniref:hypothetical protein n=1 Tax=Novosphingobium naphthalenivorans TaxID=273168 RepID=UPI000B168634|nr:hypothetical protein [Novosphingobium naphthalenivorans]
MWQELQAQHFDIRFSLRPIDGRIAKGKDPPVEPANDPSNGTENHATDGTSKPKASAWLWRPWQAKMWWAGIAVYWAGKWASFYVPSLESFYTSALAGYLNLLFFPMTALLILGIGFAQAWFAASDWEFVEPTHEQMFPELSVGGYSDPASDPLDPRSGLHWQHFHRN